MSERNGLRYGLLGLALIVLLGVLAFIANRPATTTVAETAAPAAAQGLQSLAELSGKAPTRRTLDIQSWKTAEGAKVLFVAAPELPMFDLRLTFAAGSSQDGDIPGLATLTNAMLNEGVAGKDVTAIAEGFESLGAEFGNGAYRDMAIASLRSLTAPEQRQPALELFTRQGFDATTVDEIAAHAGVGRTTFFRLFATKEAVVFPDHASIQAALDSRLAVASTGTSEVALLEGAMIVLDHYLAEGSIARARYALTSTIPILRAAEVSSQRSYERIFRTHARAWGHEELDAEPVLPGFRVSLSEVFGG